MPVEPPTALERFALGRVEIPRRPFGERSPYAIGNVKVTTRAKDALDEVREELEVVLGERLSHPAAFEVVIGFVAARRREFLAHALGGRDVAS